MKILVTGASGFLGSNVMDESSRMGHTAIGFVRSVPPVRPPDVDATPREYIAGDVRDPESIRRAVRTARPTHIVHAAAVTPTVEMERGDPRRIVETNELSTLAVLQSAAEVGVEGVIFVSSAAVYAHDVTSSRPLNEDSPLTNNGGLYALTKIASERLCRWSSEHLGLDTVSLRFGPVYGNHEAPTASRQRMSVINRAVSLALGGEPILCSKPEAVFDWIYAIDAARAVLTALQMQRPISDTYNVAGPNTSMIKLLDALGQVIPATDVRWVSEGEQNLEISNGYRRAPLDTTRLQNELGFEHAFSLTTGLTSYVDWLTTRTT